MRKQLINQQNLTRRPRWLSVLSALLLLPIVVWAQEEDYSKTICVDSKDEAIWINSENAADILGDGRMSYDAENNELTLNGVTLSCTATDASFISCVDWSQDLNTLTIRLVGSNTITLGSNAGFFYGSALTFTVADANASLTIEKQNGWSGVLFNNSDNGDPTITPTYNDHLYLDDGVDGNENEYIIQTLPYPLISTGMDNNDHVTFGFGYQTDNNDEEIHYSIDYVDENLQDVTDAVFDVSGNNLPLSGPCTLTYYTTAGGGQSETKTAKLFGLATNSVATALGSPVAPPTIVPAFDHSGDLIIAETATTSVAPVYNQETGFIETSAVGETTCSVKLDNYDAGSYDYVVINETDNDEKYLLGTFTLTVNEPIDYGLSVAGIAVTSANAPNVLSDDGTPTVVYTPGTEENYSTLTLNGATLTGGIRTRLSELYIDIIGENSITSSDGAAIQSLDESVTPVIYFMSSGSTLGRLTLTPASTSAAWENVYAYYDYTFVRFFGVNEDNNPIEGEEVVVRRIPQPVFDFTQGVVFTDEDLTIRQDIASDDFDIYYRTRSMAQAQEDYQKYTGPIRLTTDDTNNGNPSVYAYTALKSDPDNMGAYSNEASRALIVIDRPTFSVAGGNYTTAQEVEIQGLPELGIEEAYINYDDEEPQMFPQVHYYFDDDTENTVEYTTGSKITVDHSCTLNAYLLAVNDSNTVVRSSLFSAEYVVRTNTNLGITFAENQSWATYYATESLITPEGLTAYVVSSVDATSGTVTTSTVDYIPMNQTVLLKHSEGAPLTDFVAEPYFGEETTVTNLLRGSAESVGVGSITAGMVYVLYNDGFTRATTGTIPAHRGYLLLSDAPVGARLAIIEGMASGLGENITVNSEHSASTVYNLNGQRVEKPNRGIFIINGKKVFFSNNLLINQQQKH